MALPPWRPVRLAIHASLAVLFAWAFHDRYWQHRDCFNELGRCYDPETRQLITSGAAGWGGLALLFGLLFLVSLLRPGNRV